MKEKIAQGLADVRAGRMISQEEVEKRFARWLEEIAWAESASDDLAEIASCIPRDYDFYAAAVVRVDRLALISVTSRREQSEGPQVSGMAPCGLDSKRQGKKRYTGFALAEDFSMVNLVHAKREQILQLARRHGVTGVRVFGSMARGDAGPQSDVDLLIEVGAEPSAWFPGGFVAELEELLGRRVQVVTERGLDELIRDRVLEEAIPL